MADQCHQQDKYYAQYQQFEQQCHQQDKEHQENVEYSLEQVVVAAKMTERRLMGQKLNSDEYKRLSSQVDLEEKTRDKKNSHEQFFRKQSAFISTMSKMQLINYIMIYCDIS